jgi:hypothetical protein
MALLAGGALLGGAASAAQAQTQDSWVVIDGPGDGAPVWMATLITQITPSTIAAGVQVGNGPDAVQLIVEVDCAGQRQRVMVKTPAGRHGADSDFVQNPQWVSASAAPLDAKIVDNACRFAQTRGVQ